MPVICCFAFLRFLPHPSPSLRWLAQHCLVLYVTSPRSLVELRMNESDCHHNPKKDGAKRRPPHTCVDHWGSADRHSRRYLEGGLMIGFPLPVLHSHSLTAYHSIYRPKTFAVFLLHQPPGPVSAQTTFFGNTWSLGEDGKSGIFLQQDRMSLGRMYIKNEC